MPGWQDDGIVQLLEKARNGDAEAFGQLYELFAPSVYRFLCAHLDDHLDAEDLTEEIFLRAWRSLPGYREQGVPFGGFLFRVARNVLVDHYRLSGRKLPELDLHEEQPGDEQVDPAQALHKAAEQKEVRRMLGKLREDYRMVLELRFFAELSRDEVAQAMGRSPGAIRVLQHRALVALRRLVARSEE